MVEVLIVVAAVVVVAFLVWGTVVRAVRTKMAMGLGVDDGQVRIDLGVLAVVLAGVTASLAVWVLGGVLRWVVVAVGAWAVFWLIGAIGRPWQERYEAQQFGG